LEEGLQHRAFIVVGGVPHSPQWPGNSNGNGIGGEKSATDLAAALSGTTITTSTSTTTATKTTNTFREGCGPEALIVGLRCGDGEGRCRSCTTTMTITTTKPLATTAILRDGGGAEASQCNTVSSIFYHHIVLAFIGDTVLATASWLDGQTDTTIN
jgi:hypothetical protein